MGFFFGPEENNVPLTVRVVNKKNTTTLLYSERYQSQHAQGAWRVHALSAHLAAASLGFYLWGSFSSCPSQNGVWALSQGCLFVMT